MCTASTAGWWASSSPSPAPPRQKARTPSRTRGARAYQGIQLHQDHRVLGEEHVQGVARRQRGDVAGSQHQGQPPRTADPPPPGPTLGRMPLGQGDLTSKTHPQQAILGRPGEDVGHGALADQTRGQVGIPTFTAVDQQAKVSHQDEGPGQPLFSAQGTLRVHTSIQADSADPGLGLEAGLRQALAQQGQAPGERGGSPGGPATLQIQQGLLQGDRQLSHGASLKVPARGRKPTRSPRRPWEPSRGQGNYSAVPRRLRRLAIPLCNWSRCPDRG